LFDDLKMLARYVKHLAIVDHLAHMLCRFTAWPEDALRSTADMYLADSDLSEELRVKLGVQCMAFHSGILQMTARFQHEAKRHFYVTPTSYLELLNAFKSLFAKRSEEVSTAKLRYENGLGKLLFTEGQVNAMKYELEVLKPQLVQASKETDALLVDVEKETIEADKVKAVVSVDEAKAKAEADKVTAIKKECEGDLAEAMPALNAAIKALDTLTKNDITEVKGMKSPPAAVKMVLEAVCIIKGLKAAKVQPLHLCATAKWHHGQPWVTAMGLLDARRNHARLKMQMQAGMNVWVPLLFFCMLTWIQCSCR
jgi:dynein heavy chain, axonemal